MYFKYLYLKYYAALTVVTYHEYSDSVSPSPKGGGGTGSAPSKSATVHDR